MTDILLSLGIDTQQAKEALKTIARASEAAVLPLKTAKFGVDTKDGLKQVDKFKSDVESKKIEMDFDVTNIKTAIDDIGSQAKQIEVVYNPNINSIDRIKQKIDSEINTATVNIDVKTDIDQEINTLAEQFKNLEGTASINLKGIKDELSSIGTVTNNTNVEMGGFETALSRATSNLKRMDSEIRGIKDTIDLTVQIDDSDLKTVERDLKTAIDPLIDVEIALNSSQAEAKLKQYTIKAESEVIDLNVSTEKAENAISKIQKNAGDIKVGYVADELSIQDINNKVKNQIKDITVNVEMQTDIDKELANLNKDFDKFGTTVKTNFVPVESAVSGLSTALRTGTNDFGEYESNVTKAQKSVQNLNDTVAKVDKSVNITVDVDDNEIGKLSKSLDDVIKPVKEISVSVNTSDAVNVLDKFSQDVRSQRIEFQVDTANIKEAVNAIDTQAKEIEIIYQANQSSLDRIKQKINEQINAATINIDVRSDIDNEITALKNKLDTVSTVASTSFSSVKSALDNVTLSAEQFGNTFNNVGISANKAIQDVKKLDDTIRNVDNSVELDVRTKGIADIQKLATEFDDLEDKANKSVNEIKSALAKLAVSGQEGTAEFQQLEKQLLEAAKAAKKIDDAIKNIDKKIEIEIDQNTAEAGGAFDNLFGGITGKVQEITGIDLGGLTQGLTGAAGAGTSLGGALSGIVAQINPATIGIAAATAAVGFLVVEFGKAIAAGAELNNALLNLKAATGVSEEGIKQFKEEAKQLFLGGVGGSVAEATTELLKLRTALRGTVEDAQLGEIGSKLSALAGLYEQDTQQLTGALANIIKNFGVSADEAFNILAAGLKNAKTPQDDFLDSFNEYSQILAENKISAEEFYGAVSKGAQAGAFNTDKIADALKEASLRLQAGDVQKAFSDITKTAIDAGQELPSFLKSTFETSLEAFNNAEIGAGEFVKRTSKAIDEALANGDINDVMARNLRVAVAGTPAEDLGKIYSEAFSKGLDFTGVQKELTDAGKSAQDAVGQYDIFANIQRKYQAFLETFGQSVFSFINQIATPIITPLENLVTFLGEQFSSVFGGLADEGEQTFQGIANVLGEIIQYAIEVGKVFISAILTPAKVVYTVIESVISIFSTLIGAFLNFGDAADDSRSGIQKFFDTVVNAANFVNTALSYVTKFINDSTQRLRDFLQGAVDGLKPVAEFIGGTLGTVFRALYDTIKSVAAFVSTTLTSAFYVVKGALEVLYEAAIKPVIDGFKNLYDIISGALLGAWNTLVNAFNAAKDSIVNAVNFIIQVFKDFTDSARTTFSPVEQFIQNIVEGVQSAFGVIGDLVGAIGSIFSDLEKKGRGSDETIKNANSGLDKTKEKQAGINKELEKQNKQQKSAVENIYKQMSAGEIYKKLLGDINYLSENGNKISKAQYDSSKATIEAALKNSEVLSKLTNSQITTLSDKLGNLGKSSTAAAKTTENVLEELKKRLVKLQVEGKATTEEYDTLLQKVLQLTKDQKAFNDATESVNRDIEFRLLFGNPKEVQLQVSEIFKEPFFLQAEFRSGELLKDFSAEQSEIQSRIEQIKKSMAALIVDGKASTLEYNALNRELIKAQGEADKYATAIKKVEETAGKLAEIKLDVKPTVDNTSLDNSRAEFADYYKSLSEGAADFTKKFAELFKPLDSAEIESLNKRKETLNADSEALVQKLQNDEMSWQDYKTAQAGIQKEIYDTEQQFADDRLSLAKGMQFALVETLKPISDNYAIEFDNTLNSIFDTINKATLNASDGMWDMSDNINVILENIEKLGEATMNQLATSSAVAIAEGQNVGQVMLDILFGNLEKALLGLIPVISGQFLAFLGPFALPAAAVATGALLVALRAAKNAIGGAEEGYNPNDKKGYGKKGTSDTELIWVNPAEAILTADMTKKNKGLIDFWFQGGTTEKYLETKVLPYVDYKAPVIENKMVTQNMNTQKIENLLSELINKETKVESYGNFKHEFGEVRFNGSDLSTTVLKSIKTKLRVMG